MATMTISLPDPMKDWIEKQIDNGDYASTSDYVRDLVRRDRARRDEQLTIDELRQLLSESRHSGIGQKSVGDLFQEATRIAKARGISRE